MSRTIRLGIVVFLVILTITILWGFLAITTAAEGIPGTVQGHLFS